MIDQLPPRPIPTESQRLTFTGSGGEYFKIWIVNLLLTIVTLGIYSAWAKVRRNEYFYRHTRLAGAGFDYHGTPLAILKGRLIAAALFGGYYAAGLISPEASLVAFCVLALVLPFLIARALRFRFHNSSYRGLRFRFVGTTGEAYKVFLGLGLATVATLFTLLPLWMHRQRRYVVGNARYGRTPFTFGAPVGDFYRIYLVAMAASIGVLFAIVLVFVVVVGSAAVAFIGGEPADAERVGSVAAAGAVVLMVPIYLAGTLGIWSYVRARVQNTVWSHAQLGPHRFESDLRARSLAAITVTNVLGIVFTLGLYKPFAEVRLMKYLASTFTLVPSGSLDEFLVGEQQPIAAVGDEAVEMFDVDLAF